MAKKIVLITSGEPSGIGPDICLDLVDNYFDPLNYLLVVIGDAQLLAKRSALLGKNTELDIIQISELEFKSNIPGQLLILNIKCENVDCVGKLDVTNSAYVLQMLDLAILLCHNNLSNIIVTAPISKEIINQSGVKFSGHTEYFALKFKCANVVMMLANQHLKVALLTTHLPLKHVADAITASTLEHTLAIINHSFIHHYGISNPRIGVCGLNPHAGEGGYLGNEELLIINPVIKKWQDNGHAVSGSHPADTIFTHADDFDVILAMYHDQGLPVLKYSGFETGINITLGLPIIRTSVDHGTALALAGTGKAKSASLIHALKFAVNGCYSLT